MRPVTSQNKKKTPNLTYYSEIQPCMKKHIRLPLHGRPDATGQFMEKFCHPECFVRLTQMGHY